MKFFGIIFAVFAVASAKHLDQSQVQTRTVATTDEFATVIWSVGRKELDQADGYLAPLFDKAADPYWASTIQKIIDSHIYIHNLGSNVGGLFYEPYTDSSSTQKLDEELHELFRRVSYAVTLARETHAASADALDLLSDRRTKCENGLDKAAEDLSKVVSQPKDKLLDVIPIAVLNEILEFFQCAASLMNDTVIVLSKKYSGSN